ncbi:STAS domain-containing protein [Candidatus Uabimicrobium sp. HlEnr_7]|uniref:STAS domain-containing protein n=1 Tax=Candidatus Uabimicrobium helgolandensis TaxID=3095367 RepID=UPI003557CED4
MNYVDKCIVINELNITIVKITGFIGNDRDHEYQAFQQYSNELLKNKNYFIVFDIQLGHVNSKFLGLMVEIYEKCTSKGGNLVLCNVSNYLMPILEMLGMTTIFSIFPNSDEAIRYFVKNYLESSL